MALPTGTGSQKSLGLTLNEILAKAAEVKQLATDKRLKLASQNVAGSEIFTFCLDLVTAKAHMAARAATPGLADYAKGVFNDDGLDIVAEYNTMISALDAAISTIDGQSPSQLAATTYTPAATAAFRGQLQALSDSVD